MGARDHFDEDTERFLYLCRFDKYDLANDNGDVIGPIAKLFFHCVTLARLDFVEPLLASVLLEDLEPRPS